MVYIYVPVFLSSTLLNLPLGGWVLGNEESSVVMVSGRDGVGSLIISGTLLHWSSEKEPWSCCVPTLIFGGIGMSNQTGCSVLFMVGCTQSSGLSQGSTLGLPGAYVRKYKGMEIWILCPCGEVQEIVSESIRWGGGVQNIAEKNLTRGLCLTKLPHQYQYTDHILKVASRCLYVLDILYLLT